VPLWLPSTASSFGSPTAKKSSRQQGLHIPPLIGDEINDDLLSNNAIDQPIGLEEATDAAR
jgi:hypothetical protein